MVATALSIIGVVLALAALALPVAIERKRRPRLSIEASEWEPETEVSWEFATVRVSNQPLRGFWGLLLTRASADGCVVSFSIVGPDTSSDVALDLPGRWSGAPEPYRTEIRRRQDDGWERVETFDHRLVPGSFRFDIPSTGVGEEVAITVHREAQAFAFNSWSYAHPAWGKPEWRLPPGHYTVGVRASASGCEARGHFALRVSDKGIRLLSGT
jgi:hypothetical protein